MGKNNNAKIPTSVLVSTIDWDEEILFDEEMCLDEVGEYLSDTYGFCHFGFDAQFVKSSSGKIVSVIVTNIQWDFS